MKDAKARLRRKKVYSFLDVGRVPVTNEHGNVVNHEVAPEPKTLAGYIARELAAQQAKTAAEQRERDNAARAEHGARVRDYWSQPVTELTASPVGVRDDVVGLQPGESEPTAGQDFLAELTQSGVTLTESGKQRLALYCQSQWKHLGAAVTVANLRRAFERLKSLGCFASGEVTEPRPAEVETQPEKTLTVDDVLRSVDTTTREGNALLKKAVDHQWMTELSPLISDWYEHLSRDYSITVSRDDARYLFGPTGWFASRGLAINVDGLNAARRHLSALGKWDALSTQEILDQRLQRNEIGRPEYMFKVNQAHRAGVLSRPVKEAQAKGLI
jgi:hypothetical protein